MMMNACTVLFAVAFVGVVTAEINWPVISQQCAQAHQVPVEHIRQFHSYEWISALNAEMNHKCYTKCVGEASGFLSPGGVIAEPYVEFAAHRQHGEHHARAVLARCLSYVPVVYDCHSSFDLFVCLQNL